MPEFFSAGARGFIDMGTFLGGGFQPVLALWSIFAHVGVQIGRELVRLKKLV